MAFRMMFGCDSVHIRIALPYTLALTSPIMPESSDALARSLLITISGAF